MSHRGVFLWKKPHKFGILLTYLYLCGAKINSFMYFTGIIIAVMTFLTIGIWHPIVIKTEYHWGIGELFAQRKRVEKGWFPKKGD